MDNEDDRLCAGVDVVVLITLCSIAPSPPCTPKKKSGRDYNSVGGPPRGSLPSFSPFQKKKEGGGVDARLVWLSLDGIWLPLLTPLVFAHFLALHLVSFVSGPHTRRATAGKKKERDENVFKWGCLPPNHAQVSSDSRVAPLTLWTLLSVLTLSTWPLCAFFIIYSSRCGQGT